MAELTLGKLKQEGKLQCGDTVYSPTLGSCTIYRIESAHTVVVRSAKGLYYRLSGLAIPNCKFS